MSSTTTKSRENLISLAAGLTVIAELLFQFCVVQNANSLADVFQFTTVSKFSLNVSNLKPIDSKYFP